MRNQNNNLSLKQLEDLKSMMSELREVSKKCDIVKETKPQKLESRKSSKSHEKYNQMEIIRFVFNNPNHNFIFTIEDIKTEYVAGKYISKYLFYKSPESENSIKAINKWRENKKIMSNFKDWIELLKRFDALHARGPITKQDEDEIDIFFEIIDIDADKSSFDKEQQKLLIRYLDKSKEYLDSKKEEYDLAEIIEEIDVLKDSLDKIPKNAVMKRISKILAYSKKKSKELFDKLLRIFETELIKKALYEGYEFFESVVKYIQSMG